MKNKIALFDFCETLVDFQTADEFIHFIRKNENSRKMDMKESLRKTLVKSKIIRVIEKITNRSLNKKLVLWQIKGFDVKILEKYAKKYYYERIKNSFIYPVLSKMKKYKKDGHKVYVVSAGYNLYLKDFIKDFNLDGLICTKILFGGGICLGKFDGKDCIGKNKIVFINDYFDKNVNDCYIVAYGDSLSDLPLLKWADEGIVVSKNKSASWAKKNKLKELIWDR